MHEGDVVIVAVTVVIATPLIVPVASAVGGPGSLVLVVVVGYGIVWLCNWWQGYKTWPFAGDEEEVEA